MSRKYKFHNKEGLYFVSFATVNWIDVFTREYYSEIIIESLKFCQTEKGLQLYAWCIMPSHIHLIFSTQNNDPSELLRDFKGYTSKAIIKAITNNPQESRKEWLLWMFKKAGSEKSNVSKMQFWQHHNKPIELWSSKVIDQKLDYLHNNPVVTGFVTQPHYWKYSSAINFADGLGLLNLVEL